MSDDDELPSFLQPPQTARKRREPAPAIDPGAPSASQPHQSTKHSATPHPEQPEPRKRGRPPKSQQVAPRTEQSDQGPAAKVSAGSAEDQLGPTAAKLLVAMFSEEHAGKTQVELGALLGISGQRVGHIQRDPTFRAALKSALETALARHMPAILAESLRNAKKDGKEGYFDRALLFRSFGLVKSVTEQRGTVQHQHTHTHSVGERLAQAQSKRDAMLRRVLEGKRDGTGAFSVESDPSRHDPGTEEEATTEEAA